MLHALPCWDLPTTAVNLQLLGSIVCLLDTQSFKGKRYMKGCPCCWPDRVIPS
jgi:hypothetical protein